MKIENGNNDLHGVDAMYPVRMNKLSHFPKLPQPDSFESEKKNECQFILLVCREKPNIERLKDNMQKFNKPGNLVLYANVGMFPVVKACMLPHSQKHFSGTVVLFECRDYCKPAASSDIC